MERPVHVVTITHHGDGGGWKSYEREFARSDEELAHYQSEAFRKEHEQIGGVDWVEVDIDRDVPRSRLANTLTYRELVELFPELQVGYNKFVGK